MELIKLDGKPLPGFEHRINFSGRIESQDLSGDSSSSADSHQGYTSSLSVSLKIKKNYPKQKEALRTLIYSTDSNNEPKRFKIEHAKTRAWKVSTVKFDGNFTDSDGYPLFLDSITFGLKVVDSVPESKEDRKVEIQKTAKRETVPTGENRRVVSPPAGASADQIVKWMSRQKGLS